MQVLGVILAIIGIIVAIIGVVGKSSSTKRLEQLSGSGKQKIGDLLPVLQETKASLSGIGDEGVIKENVTVMGQPQCQQPLTSPIAGIPCLYYKYRVSIRRTEYYMETETDANGNQRQVQKSRTDEKTLDSGESCVQSFIVNDGTGNIIVEPQNGTFEGLVKSVDKSESNYAGMMNNGMLNLGRLSLNMNSLMNGMMPNNGMMSNNGMMNNGMMSGNGMMSNNGMMNNGMMNNNAAAAAAGVAAGVAIASAMGNNNMMGNNNPSVIKYVEEIVGLDRNVTVVGTVCDNMGDFRIRSVAKSKVIVSTKSAEEMLTDAQSSIKTNNGMAIGGGVGLVIGIIMALLGGGDDEDTNNTDPAANPPAQEAPAKK